MYSFICFFFILYIVPSKARLKPVCRQAGRLAGRGNLPEKVDYADDAAIFVIKPLLKVCRAYNQSNI
jgi:hypothetical protein